jgi:hypothetical protein
MDRDLEEAVALLEVLHHPIHRVQVLELEAIPVSEVLLMAMLEAQAQLPEGTPICQEVVVCRGGRGPSRHGSEQMLEQVQLALIPQTEVGKKHEKKHGKGRRNEKREKPKRKGRKKMNES